MHPRQPVEPTMQNMLTKKEEKKKKPPCAIFLSHLSRTAKADSVSLPCVPVHLRGFCSLPSLHYFFGISHVWVVSIKRVFAKGMLVQAL